MSETTLQIKRLTLDAILPTRASPGSVGYDLYSLNDMVREKLLVRVYVQLYRPGVMDASHQGRVYL